MYWIEDGNGRRRPCANAPRARITNLQEVFGMLDAGTDPCIAHAEYADGDTMDVEVSSNYALNSLGRKTRIEGNELFAKRLRQDLEYLARCEWGHAHQWDASKLGSWTDTIGVPCDETPVDPSIVARLQPVFPESDISGWLNQYAIRRRWAPVPSAATLIRVLEERNRPLRPYRPAKSGIAFETRATGYGEMGVARDKRTGQTWMWPMGEERERYIRGYLLNQDQSDRMDRRDIKNALNEELRRGGLPESFDYPCHAADGRIVWCLWSVEYSPVDERPIMMGERPGAERVGTLTCRREEHGLRWWQWTDTDGVRGERFPSFEQAMLDFIDSTDLSIRHY